MTRGVRVVERDVGAEEVGAGGMALLRTEGVVVDEAAAAFVAAVKAGVGPLEQRWVQDAQAKGLPNAASVLTEFRSDIARASN